MLGRLIPQWFLEQYPWTRDFLEWFDWVRQVFHAYEGVILFVGLVIVWRGLRNENKKLGDRIDTLRQLVSAVRDQSEVAPIPAAATSTGSIRGTPADNDGSQSGREFFEAIRQLWRSARERIELAIEDIPRSRVRSKYGQLPRYSYREVILALSKDGILGSKEMTELLRMNGLFDGLRSRPTAATASQLENFKEAYRIGTKRLPKVPEAEDALVVLATAQHATEPAPQVQAAAS